MAKLINPLTDNLEDICLKTLLLHLKSFCCSSCGWDKAPCDIHHIIPKSKGGTDNYDNLTYICPNCHRLAHRNKLFEFVSIKDQIGNSWKDFFDNRRNQILERLSKNGKVTQNFKKNSDLRKELRDANASTLVDKLREENLDYSKYGWAKEAALVIGISPQKVRSWIKEFAPDLIENAFVRKRPATQFGKAGELKPL